MPDPAALRDIADALDALKAKADAAGSPMVRALLTMTAAAVREDAAKAEREAPQPVRRPRDMMRRLGGP